MSRLGGDQPIAAEVVIGGGIEVDQPLLKQLHHGDGGEGLGDGADPEDRVLGDGRVRRDVGEPVSVEKLEASVANRSQSQANRRPAVEDPADSCLSSS
jgi:hypothetical protein